MIDPNAALGSAERQADEGALPGHEHRQSRHLAEVDVGREADAAFGRAHGEHVLHPIAERGVDLVVRVAAERERDDNGTLRRPQPLVEVGVEIDELRDPIELSDRLTE